jgi:putative transposase
MMALRVVDRGDEGGFHCFLRVQTPAPTILKEEGSSMARLARVIAAGVPHHITQRGNARRFILQDDVDREVYLDLLQQSMEMHRVGLIGYCLMSNHVHLVAIPHKTDVLALALKFTHGRFASYWNATHHSTGHVWQGRYYSCPLDETHLWEALRYTELNPVRASLVPKAEGWHWSSAQVHCATANTETWMTMQPWRNRRPSDTWRDYLNAGETESNLIAIRHNTHTGRPLGSAEFTRALEKETKRRLTFQRRGPKKKTARGESQQSFSF